MYLWAGVSFVALGGQTADFLQRAANQNFKLRHIRPQFGGVLAQCEAKRYVALCKLARVCHVHLQISARHGIYFRVRSLRMCKGLWCGTALFLIFYLCNQNLIWQIDDSDLTIGQQARVAEILWGSCGIAPGAYISQDLLASGEAAILAQTDEFSWVSLNFSGGRLTIEATTAAPVPEIAVGNEGDLVAITAGEVVSVNVQQGTAMVRAGESVVAGQVLIAAARLEHDEETLVYEPTAGQVLAIVDVYYGTSVSLMQQVPLPATPIEIDTSYSFFVLGHLFSLPNVASVLHTSTQTQESKTQTSRMWQLEWLGFVFPVTVLEENAVYYQTQEVSYTETQALDMLRLTCSAQLYETYPDANIVLWEETVLQNEGRLILQVECQIITDICSLQE